MNAHDRNYLNIPTHFFLLQTISIVKLTDYIIMVHLHLSNNIYASNKTFISLQTFQFY